MVLAATVLVLILQAPVDNDAGMSFKSYVNQRRWESVIRAADLEKSPRWVASADSPPLAPRAAVRAARHVLDAIFTAGEGWDFSRMSLQQMMGIPDRWVYLVDFGERPPPPKGIGSFIGDTMTIVVLMDGTAIRPTGHPLEK
jgi:hypothetical protein